ncbi:MAG: replicative DNA helicase [Candidatus Sericytochromatia bacterium]|nr:MAG: replicative DNA helicase [Candidatus Sericytochromatia bacterium]
MIDKIQPHNLEAERAVIGSMLLDKDAVIKCLEILKPNYFYAPNHQTIFRVMLDLFNINKPIDLITISDTLRNLNLLDDIGGYIYLVDLTESIPSTANVEQYASIVEEKYIRRELIRISNEIIELSYESNEDISLLLDKAEKEIFNLGQKKFTKDLIHIRDTLVDSFDVISNEDFYDATKIVTRYGISTGINDLDQLTNGLRPSNLIVVAARPAMGKTSFCLNLATNIALREKYPVAIFSLEMSKEELSQRILCAEAEISLQHFRSGNIPKEMWEKITNTISKLYSAPIYIDDSSYLTPIEMRSKLRRLKAEHKKLGAVIVDYIQLMEIEGSENRVQEIAKISRNLKRIARELDVPVIALSQLSRNVEQRQNKRPQLSDLRESGSIEQDADIVMFLYRDEYYNPNTDKKKIAELIIAKHRSGPVDTIELYFDASLTKFSGLER